MQVVMLTRRSRHVHHQRGISLVELMVGIAVGLFIVAAATTLMSGQLVDNRKLLLETQIQQDLRSSMDIVTRQLRRAGAQSVAQMEGGIALATDGGRRNSFAEALTPATTVDSKVGFSFFRNADDAGPYGFTLEEGVLKTGPTDNLQELTDSSTVKVTAFSVRPVNVDSVALPCPNVCADGTSGCWPRLVVRELLVSITAEAKSDPSVKRTISSNVRLRNDWVRFGDSVPNVCP